MESEMNQTDEQPYIQATSMTPIDTSSLAKASMMEMQFDHSKEMQLMEAYLRGARWDEKKKAFVYFGDSKPLMNELGISKMLSILQTYFNKPFKITYSDDDDVTNTFLLASESVNRELAFNYRLYGIEKHDRHTLRSGLFTTIFAILRISKYDLQRIHMDRISSYSENITIPNQQPQQNRMGRFWNSGGG